MFDPDKRFAYRDGDKPIVFGRVVHEHIDGAPPNPIFFSQTTRDPHVVIYHRRDGVACQTDGSSFASQIMRGFDLVNVQDDVEKVGKPGDSSPLREERQACLYAVPDPETGSIGLFDSMKSAVTFRSVCWPGTKIIRLTGMIVEEMADNG